MYMQDAARFPKEGAMGFERPYGTPNASVNGRTGQAISCCFPRRHGLNFDTVVFGILADALLKVGGKSPGDSLQNATAHSCSPLYIAEVEKNPQFSNN